jgi:hypothetical protein
MTEYFTSKQNYKSLSIRDLLEARDSFHVHLYNKENVIATAIGKYRIRKEDPDAKNPLVARDKEESPPRTFENTVIKPWSWPCILVFVDRWLTRSEMKDMPEQVVPPSVYMPDGRVVPLCVMLAQKKSTSSPGLNELTFTTQLMGGGYPVISNVQGQQRVGTIGCLVTDGHSVYALTNKHVTGEILHGSNDDQGSEIYTIINGKTCKIGSGYPKQLGKKLFADIYNGYPGKNVFSNVDAGLIRLEDVSDFTAQIFGIGEMGDLVDLNPYNISLDLVGCPVRAFGGASGQMRGEIQALFYRYKSVGGFDYVSDLVIGRLRNDNMDFVTKPGDSGTLWFYDPRLISIQEKDTDQDRGKADLNENNPNILSNSFANVGEPATQDVTNDLKEVKKYDSKSFSKGARASRLRPIALQWGGQVLTTGDQEKELNFALATCLSTICRELDIELVRNWNTGYSEYWGKLGHYKVGAKAIDLLSNQKLLKLMRTNLNSISFNDDSLREGDHQRIEPDLFVPLADVADIAWKNTRGDKEKPTHFADIDQEGNNSLLNKTLLSLFEENKDSLNIKIWNKFYESINTVPKYRGSLPFRIWQIYNEMVMFLKEKSVEKFVCAAGIISHYLGDACQPLHSSKYHHGLPEAREDDKVHDDYETKMLDKFGVEIVTAINDKLDGVVAAPSIKGGFDAAVNTMTLMKNVMQILPPLEILRAFNEFSGRNKFKKMYEALGPNTVDCLSEGSILLATLWESAWLEGQGDLLSDAEIEVIDKSVLTNLYMDNTFLESFQLTDARYEEKLS